LWRFFFFIRSKYLHREHFIRLHFFLHHITPRGVVTGGGGLVQVQQQVVTKTE